MHGTRTKNHLSQPDNKSNTHFHQKINTNHCCVKFKWFSTFYAQYALELGLMSLDPVICPDYNCTHGMTNRSLLVREYVYAAIGVAVAVAVVVCITQLKNEKLTNKLD